MVIIVMARSKCVLSGVSWLLWLGLASGGLVSVCT